MISAAGWAGGRAEGDQRLGALRRHRLRGDAAGGPGDQSQHGIRSRDLSLASDWLQAVEEGQFIVTDGASIRRGIKAVGLVNWGMVEDAAEMVVPEETSSVPTVHYSGSPDIEQG